MANVSTFNSYENDDCQCLLTQSISFLCKNEYLKSNIRPPTLLTLKRSLSLEHFSTDEDDKTKDEQRFNLSSSNNTKLNGSLNLLCFRFEGYKTLIDCNQNILPIEDDLNMLKTIGRLRIIFQKQVTSSSNQNYSIIEIDEYEEEIIFQYSKRKGRRNAICLALDRMYYNDQLILVVTIAKQVQSQSNLIYSDLKP